MVAFVRPVAGVLVFAFAVVLPSQIIFGNSGWTDEQNQTRTIILSVLGMIALAFWVLGKTSRVRQYAMLHNDDAE